jgi:hypothetical protein
MSEQEYDFNYRTEAIAAGFTPADPMGLRGVIKQLLLAVQSGAPVNTVAAATNAGTVPVTSSVNTFTNTSAATMTITMATTGAADGQGSWVRIYDFSAVAETITWVNTENGEGTAPTTSNGSTTLPKTAYFQFNGKTSKWRCIIS